MGKAGRWIKHFLIGKKDREKEKNETTLVAANGHIHPVTVPPVTPREKKRWSFRRSSATAPPPGGHHHKDLNPAAELNCELDKHAMALAAATAAAADAAVAAAKASAAVIQLTSAASGRATTAEEFAAVKIQSYFRSYLARKALNALKGLVKLQALVRGHLVRKQAAATLRCMQALITVQSRARAQRLQMVQESNKQFNHRKSTHDFRRHSYQDSDGGLEENVKIVEMDHGDSRGSTRSRNSYSSYHNQADRFEHRISTQRFSSKQQDHQHNSPAPPSAITDFSPRTCSNHFEDYSLDTAQSSPHHSAISRPESYAESFYSEYPFCPSYMANTESSRAKVRSHSAPRQRPPESYERTPSAPKQRPESVERQPSRRRPSIEGRSLPRGVKMQRSSSHVGSTAQNYQYPWSLKLDKSSVSLKESECGSNSTVISNANYCRSLVGFEVHGYRY